MAKGAPGVLLLGWYWATAARAARGGDTGLLGLIVSGRVRHVMRRATKREDGSGDVEGLEPGLRQGLEPG